MSTKVKIETDPLCPEGLTLRTLHVSDDESGMQTVIVRPWKGAVEIRSNGESLTIDAFAMPAVIRALRQALAEAIA